MTQSKLPKPLRHKEQRLQEVLAECGSSLLAYSGGVDSALLAVVAQDVLVDGFAAVLADSPSLPDWEKGEALHFAAQQGFPVRVIRTAEMELGDYRANGLDRCFHCKSELFGLMESIAEAEGFQSLLYGGNLSDRSDHRPGADAARRFNVRAPLEEAGLVKEDIRQLARARGLSVWDRPARACLASRIPHFEEVTEAKLSQVANAENILRGKGFRDYRVRHHGDLARIEMGAQEWDRLAEPELREAVMRGIVAQGYLWIALDLKPFISGNLSRAAEELDARGLQLAGKKPSFPTLPTIEEVSQE